MTMLGKAINEDKSPMVVIWGLWLPYPWPGEMLPSNNFADLTWEQKWWILKDKPAKTTVFDKVDILFWQLPVSSSWQWVFIGTTTRNFIGTTKRNHVASFTYKSCTDIYKRCCLCLLKCLSLVINQKKLTWLFWQMPQDLKQFKMASWMSSCLLIMSFVWVYQKQGKWQ